MDKTKRILRLALIGEYFDAIADGSKLEEYRLVTPYWTKRLASRQYDEIVLTKGYPPSYMINRFLRRPWRGCEVKTITAKHFGNDPVKVYAIKVN